MDYMLNMYSKEVILNAQWNGKLSNKLFLLNIIEEKLDYDFKTIESRICT